MSRVFEALVRAREQAQNLDGSRGSAQEVLRDSGKITVDPHLNGSVSVNGHQKDLPGIVPPSLTSKNKSWRERIEELFFGWDLARYQRYPIVSIERDSAASEQYKILREHIKRLRIAEGIDAFSVTSPVKRDGKTTVAVNLAAVLALDFEERILLIDGDLRAPAVHRYFNVPVSPGLSDYLNSNSRNDAQRLVRETFLPGLRILPAGRPSHMSSELLAKEKMRHLLEELRSEFPGYRIMFDSPPALSTSDPTIIARYVDAVLLVIRAEKTPRDYLTKALEALNSTKLMGIVLNGASMGMSSKYYSYTTNGSY